MGEESAIASTIQGLKFPVDEDKMYYEEIIDGNRKTGLIFSSTVIKAKQNQIKDSILAHQVGECDGSIVYDESEWMYDIRYCAICGRGLGLI